MPWWKRAAEPEPAASDAANFPLIRLEGITKLYAG
jgi:hypothetical protein